MSRADHALPRAPWRTRTDAAAGAAAPGRLAVYGACVLLALLCNYLLGQDVGWDTLDYHLYAGLAAVHDRFAQDYFAGGPQSYFNPYVYAPFYLLVRSGLPALAVSSILAVLQSSVLWLTYELALCACPSQDRRIRLACGACAVAFAFLNPVLIEQLGSSFADITTAALVLAGWLLLAQAVQAPRSRLIVGAGVILGAATALKLTNAVHAVAGCGLLVLLPGSLSGRLRGGATYAGALAAGFAVIAAPWGYRLERMFGNPLFPLLNGIFRSPEYTTVASPSLRFIPGNLTEALWRPFAIANPVPTVQVELLAPDIRYAVLIVLLGALAFRSLWRRSRPSPQAAVAAPAANSRVLAALGCGLALDWVLWLVASGNGRYFLPMACVTSVVIVALLFRDSVVPPRLRNYALAAILGIQLLQVSIGTDHRWSPATWDGAWFKVMVPGKLATEPNLYLTIGMQTNSFIAPYLAAGSGLINFSGGYALGSQSASGARVASLIRRYGRHVRMLVEGDRLHEDREGHLPLRSRVDDALERFGLRVDMGDCATITVRGIPQPPQIQVGSTAAPGEQSRDTLYLVSCRVVAEEPADYLARLAAQSEADLVLDHLEDACPSLFQPRRLVTEHESARWQRQYMNTDLVAWVSHGQVKFRQVPRGREIYLGSASEWATAPPRLSCGRRDGYFFADLPSHTTVSR